MMGDSNTEQASLNIGILSIQGAFHEHKQSLLKSFEIMRCRTTDINSLATKVSSLHIKEIREEKDILGLDGMILPGGESTTMGKSLDRGGFISQIRDWLSGTGASPYHKPVIWGTCAGLILLANKLESDKAKLGGQTTIGGLDVTVSRNFFGRQFQSFESIVHILDETVKVDPEDSKEQLECHGVFIRAPAITECDNENVQILGTVNHPDKGSDPIVVAVKQENIIGTAFHPELTNDLRWHTLFLRQIFVNKFKLDH